MTIIIAIQDGTTEQATGKIPIFLILKFGQQGLISAILLIKAFDGLQNERINNLFIIVPIKALVFEQHIELLKMNVL